MSLDAAAVSDDRPDARADALAQHVVAHVVVAAEAAAQLGHHAARTVGHVARRRVDGVGRLVRRADELIAEQGTAPAPALGIEQVHEPGADGGAREEACEAHGSGRLAGAAGGDELERLVVIVTTDFTACHTNTPFFSR